MLGRIVHKLGPRGSATGGEINRKPLNIWVKRHPQASFILKIVRQRAKKATIASSKLSTLHKAHLSHTYTYWCASICIAPWCTWCGARGGHGLHVHPVVLQHVAWSIDFMGETVYQEFSWSRLNSYTKQGRPLLHISNLTKMPTTYNWLHICHIVCYNHLVISPMSYCFVTINTNLQAWATLTNPVPIMQKLVINTTHQSIFHHSRPMWQHKHCNWLIFSCADKWLICFGAVKSHCDSGMIDPTQALYSAVNHVTVVVSREVVNLPRASKLHWIKVKASNP